MLLLDHMKCCIQLEFLSQAEAIGTKVFIVPAGHTEVLQPADVGILKSVKTRLQFSASKWKHDCYAAQGGPRKMPAPSGNQVADWLDEV